MSERDEMARLIMGEHGKSVESVLPYALSDAILAAGYRKIGPDEVVVLREPTEELNRIWWNNGGPKPPWEQMIAAAERRKPKP